MKKIGLIGKLRSGKDTVATILKNDYGFHSYAFGDGVKAVYHTLVLDAPRSPKPRAGYQRVGEGMKGIFGDYVWVERVLGEIERDGRMSDDIVITDVRLPLEADRLKELGFILVRVNCPDEIRLNRANQLGDIFTEKELAHSTETLVDTLEVDYEIHNSGTLEELERQVHDLIRCIEEEKRG